MKRTLPLYLLLILLLLAGCNDPKHITDALHRAEALMDENPDSAWVVLNTLSSDEMGQNRTRAHYALLYTQAQDKTYRDETNDSLISIAVDYYRHTDDARRKFLSYYYKGRVMVNAGESIKAMLLFLEAEKLSEEVDDGYLLGLLYTQMGDIYKNYYNYSKSLEMFQEAAVVYERAKKDLHRLYALVDQANVYKNMEKNEESYRLLHVVLNESKQKRFHRLVELCLGDLTMLCVKLKKLDEADLLVQKLQKDYDLSSMSSSFLADVAKIYAMKKEWNLSQEMLKKAWRFAKTANDTIALHFGEAYIHELKYPETDAYYSMLEGVEIQNKLVRKSMEQPILSVQNKLLETEFENQQYKFQIERVQRWSIVLLVIVMSIGIVYRGQKWLRKLYRKRVRELLQKKEDTHQLALDHLLKEMAVKDENIHNLITEFNSKLDVKDANFRRVLIGLENEITSKNKLNDEYVQQVEIVRHDREVCLAKLNQLFVERIELTDEIIRVQNSDFGSDKMKTNVLLKMIGDFASQVTKSKRFYKDLEDWVNLSNQNVMLRLRSEVKLPDEDFYRQVCFHIAGYSVYSISVLMGETKNKIYKRKDRIRKKIEDLGTESMDLLLKLLCK